MTGLAPLEAVAIPGSMLAVAGAGALVDWWRARRAARRDLRSLRRSERVRGALRRTTWR